MESARRLILLRNAQSPTISNLVIDVDVDVDVDVDIDVDIDVHVDVDIDLDGDVVGALPLSGKFFTAAIDMVN